MAEFVPPFIMDLYTEGSPTAELHEALGVAPEDLIVDEAGFVHGAKGYEDWGLPPEDDEVVAWKVASLREAGTHIMGRATYEAMAPVWPNTCGYADVMNEIPTVVTAIHVYLPI